MKLDEFAFVNQQLAGMLQSGMPLEGALKELCQGSASGELKTELTALEKDLAGGRKLEDAIADRNLPGLYRQAIMAGTKGNDLPTILTSLAGHYARLHATWERVRGILVYPTIVLILATMVSIGASIFITKAIKLFAPETFNRNLWYWRYGDREFFTVQQMVWETWLPTVFLIGVSIATLVLLKMKATRRRLNWWLPALREVQLANFASSMHVMLRGGVPLPESLSLISANHADDPLGAELDTWRDRISAGEKNMALAMKSSRLVPPMFAWAISSSGPDLAAGFSKAADIYERRARYRTELMLNIFLPFTIIILGIIIVVQAMPLFRWMNVMMNMFGF